MNVSNSLATFPQRIADQSYKLLIFDGAIRDAREAIAIFESEIDSAIAFGEFKNDGQRKAAKAQMMGENQALQDLIISLRGLTTERDKAAIEFALLKDSFSIRKLEARERIAKIESLAA
jgi:hypothetical protein